MNKNGYIFFNILLCWYIHNFFLEKFIRNFIGYFIGYWLYKKNGGAGQEEKLRFPFI